MRVLMPPVPQQDTVGVDIHAHYAADWISTGGLRVNFVASADGSAHADGKSAGLQTPGDNRVFAALRDLADVVLVGAGTAVTEGYGPLRFDDRRLAIRNRYGLAAHLPLAVISRSLRLDPGAAMFTDVDSAARTIVLTCAAAPADVRAELAEVADVIECGRDTVDPVLARNALTGRGLARILAEGGPSVFAEQVGAGVVDELCLSVSPLLVGPGPARIMGGTPWTRPHELALAGLLEEDGALFARYLLRR